MENTDYPASGSKYKGYIIDLLDRVSQNLNFSYDLRLVEDRQYGAQYQDTNGASKWTGMVGEVIYGVSSSCFV